jgi:hypothetical protein
MSIVISNGESLKLSPDLRNKKVESACAASDLTVLYKHKPVGTVSVV